MKKSSVFFLILAVVLLISCGGEVEKTEKTTRVGKLDKAEGVTIEVVEGIKHVKNTSPIKGTISLETGKLLEIDSASIKSEKGAFFSNVDRDQEGNIYLLDMYNVIVRKFSKEGKLLKSFLQKGEGPGELMFALNVRISGNNLWASFADQFCRFDREGTFLEKKQFKRRYGEIIHVDENTFIGTYDRFEEGKKIGNAVALINKDEQVLTELLAVDDPNIGHSELRVEGRGFRFVSVGITPLLRSAYSGENGKLYLCASNDYKIYVKNLNAETQIVIHNLEKKQGKKITPQDKEEILGNYKRFPIQWRDQFRKEMPPTFQIIRRIAALPNGLMAVYRITGFSTVEIDIYDKNGQFLYIITPSQEIPNLRRAIFFKDRVAIISTREAGDIYEEFRVKNFPEIY